MPSTRISPAMAIILWLFSFVIVAHAHMQMTWPFPIKSSIDPANSDPQRDYNMAAPLEANGANFPCKNYHLTPASNTVKAVYSPGQTYNITIGGSASHLGGSCQISLSYDNGATFKVIKSMEGGCPLTPHYDFTIPSFAPASDAVLLSWTWFNIVGNREMYQNCARVSINNRVKPRYERLAEKRATTIGELPDMFVCNVGNGCTTIEKREIKFPQPGADVTFGQNGVTPDPGPGFQGGPSVSSSPAVVSTTASPVVVSSILSPSSVRPTTSSVSPGSTQVSAIVPVSSSVPPSSSTLPNVSSATSPSSSALPSAIVYTSSTMSITASPGAFFTRTLTTSTTETLTSAMPSTNTVVLLPPPEIASSTLGPSSGSVTIPASQPLSVSVHSSRFITSTSTNSFKAAPTSGISPGTILTGPCTPGNFACNSLDTWSQCVATGSGQSAYTYMGVVAPGTQCVEGQFIRKNSGVCSPSGRIVCNGVHAFYMCVEGGLINMGPLAAGTVCKDNAILAG